MPTYPFPYELNKIMNEQHTPSSTFVGTAKTCRNSNQTMDSNNNAYCNRFVIYYRCYSSNDRYL